MKIDFVRELSIKILNEIEENKAYSNIVLDKYIRDNREKLTNKDVGFLSEIVYGTVMWKLTINEIINFYSNIKINKISKWIKYILQIGIYQIIFLDKVPKSAAVNESVNLSKKYGVKSSGFVNAILRKVEKNSIEEVIKDKNEKQKLSIKYSMPLWIVDELYNDYKSEEVEKICIESIKKAKTTIRINSLKTNKEKIKEEFDKRNIEYKEIPEENFLQVNLKSISELDLFKEGYFTVQDISAGLPSKILNPKPGDVILDACSSPGGKTTYLAEIMKNKGEIIACDIYEHRLNLVKQNSKRLGINIIETKIQDAAIYNRDFLEKFDKILLDVPCMGIGVIKRKPDIKWQRKKEDIEEITNIQKEILWTCSKYLKSKGEIVYSTCSILKNENENIINEFLDKNKCFKKVLEKNILPNEEQDGFFICKLYKN